MTSANPSAKQPHGSNPSEQLERFLGSFTETAVVFRYLDLLAERTQALEQRIGLNELNQLRQENKRLRERKKRLPVSMGLLSLYLPIIYHNFWNTVRPDHLAILAGSTHVPVIPSPYEEPDEWMVLDMKRSFKQLSNEDRASIINFCHQLPYQLKVRRSMQMLLEDSA